MSCYINMFLQRWGEVKNHKKVNFKPYKKKLKNRHFQQHLNNTGWVKIICIITSLIKQPVRKWKKNVICKKKLKFHLKL